MKEGKSESMYAEGQGRDLRTGGCGMRSSHSLSLCNLYRPCLGHGEGDFCADNGAQELQVEGERAWGEEYREASNRVFW